MKVISYQRISPATFPFHSHSYTHFFYIPQEKIVLYREQYGTFGNITYSMTKNPEILEEAEKIMNNQIPNNSWEVLFSNIKVFEYDNSKLRKIIRKAKFKSKLEDYVSSGIKELIQNSESS